MKKRKKLFIGMSLLVVLIVIIIITINSLNNSVAGVYQIGGSDILVINKDGSYEMYDDAGDYKSGEKYSFRGVWELKEDDCTIEFTNQYSEEFCFRKYDDILIRIKDNDNNPILYSYTVPSGKTFYLKLRNVYGLSDYTFNEDGTCEWYDPPYYGSAAEMKTYTYFLQNNKIYMKDSSMNDYEIRFYIYQDNHIVPKSEVAIKYKK
ncbi:MAG: hypothetical protein IJZ35_06235 [Clostridia bacterium]|nr:hypothetical protein [Clostridia bacterium]